MEEKNRRPSGSGETKQKRKSSNKKKRKNKAKDRERKITANVEGKANSYEETNSDSAVDFGKRKPKGSQSHSSEGSRTKLTTSKNSLSTLQNSKGVQSAPVIGTRSLSSSGVSLLDKKGLMDLYALFPSESEPDKLAVSASRSSADSEQSEVAETVDESMRWENAESDPEDEAERLRVYKMNRRKRYLIDAYQKRDDKEGVLKLAKEIGGRRDDNW
ncbi:uncharacterized protein [Amphiura filiformis]|uniref:uncharacterized protein isoform X1 n=1 Tax=Amphiura filiformis TaxID=82378 RepID=UPI003B22820B